MESYSSPTKCHSVIFVGHVLFQRNVTMNFLEWVPPMEVCSLIDLSQTGTALLHDDSFDHVTGSVT